MEIDNNYNQRITDFLIRHLDCSIKMLSLHFRWKEEQVAKFESYLHWYNLSSNENFEIKSFRFLSKYEDKLSWKPVCQNQRIIGNMHVLHSFKDKICWPTYFNNPNVKIDKGILFQYPEKIVDLSSCTRIPWTDDFIEKYKDKWDWSALSSNPSLCWSAHLIDKYCTKWNWTNLSHNQNLPWTEELIDKYYYKWEWHALTANTGLPWSLKFIKKYHQKFSSYIFPHNKALPWHKKDKLKKYVDCSLFKVSCNPKAVSWSKEFVIENSKEIDFKMLTCNKGFPWEFDILEKYESKWNYDDLYKMSGLWEKVFKIHVTDELVEFVLTQKHLKENNKQNELAKMRPQNHYNSDAGNARYYEEAAFNFLTEGEFGDYDDFDGDIEGVMTWLGRD